MAEITSQQMAGKLLAAGFERSGPSASTLSDPIADTPMVVTLDQLRPYDHDPRKNATRPTRKSRRPSASAVWTRRRPSLADQVRTTTSSATAEIRGWRSCANYGQRPRTSGFSVYRACSGRGPAAAKSSC